MRLYVTKRPLGSFGPSFNTPPLEYLLCPSVLPTRADFSTGRSDCEEHYRVVGARRQQLHTTSCRARRMNVYMEFRTRTVQKALKEAHQAAKAASPEDDPCRSRYAAATILGGCIKICDIYEEEGSTTERDALREAIAVVSCQRALYLLETDLVSEAEASITEALDLLELSPQRYGALLQQVRLCVLISLGSYRLASSRSPRVWQTLSDFTGAYRGAMPAKRLPHPTGVGPLLPELSLHACMSAHQLVASQSS